ncbi:MAG: tetratricopeptide repeat protein [Bacteroidota bacterium]
MIKLFFLHLTFLTTLITVPAQDQNKIQIASEYYQQGDLEKAKEIYVELSKSPYNIQLIAANYLSVLKALHETKEAELFLKYAIKTFPNNMQFVANLAGLYADLYEPQKLNNYINTIKKESRADPYQLGILAQYFISEELYNEAIEFFKESRKLRGVYSMHALELAAVYRIVDNKPAMIEEYLNYASDSPNRLSYVKNLLQNYIREEKEFDELESTLIKKMQENPGDTKFPELLIWVELQRKNFSGAFIQARAIDKRNKQAGDKTMQIGHIALDNKSYEDAEEIFLYVASEYPFGRNYSLAKKLWMEAKEEKIKNTYPIDPQEIKALTDQYSILYQELFPSQTAFEALRNKALLHAFYLDEIDKASEILNQLINSPQAGRTLVSKSKLDLGDIYLLKGEPWESTLLYSQVEKANKSSTLAYDAKLRNARLNYFSGNFALAKGHLDILKKNTTRNISNDALSLGMLITDNTALDTTDQVMKEFADVELLIFQNKKNEARKALSLMLIKYEHHPITDEVYWLLAKLELERGNAEKSLEYLDQIISSFAYDILADDASFKKAEVYDLQLNDIEKAKELYQQFLIEYPGSLYAAEARKRFRKLRGDFLN